MIITSFLILALAWYWNHQTFLHVELLRKHVNERLARLERGAEDHKWDLPRTSFGYYGAIDDWEV